MWTEYVPAHLGIFKEKRCGYGLLESCLARDFVNCFGVKHSLGPQAYCICPLYTSTILKQGKVDGRAKKIAGDDLLAKRSQAKRGIAWVHMSGYNFC